MKLHTLIKILTLLTAALAGPPVFEDKVTIINANADEVLEIKCSATGDPLPSYSWYYEASFQNGEQLGPKSYPPVEIREKSNSSMTYSVLVFNKTKVEYSGTYTCMANNSHGLRSKIYEVFINETNNEDIVVTNVAFFNVTDTSVTVLLKATGKISSVTVKFAEKLDTEFKQLSFKEDEPIVVNNLIPSGAYNFTFAINADASVKTVWTKNYTVVLLPAVPDVIFHNLGGGTLDIAWFRTFADFRRETIDKYLLTYNTIHIQSGDYWVQGECPMKIEIPNCFGAHYVTSNLYKDQYYQLQLQAHTSAGYGRPFVSKIHVS